MKPARLETIHCPRCGGALQPLATWERSDEIVEGKLVCEPCSMAYPIINYIPRLVNRANYSSSWGQLWGETGQILRDSFTGVPFHYNTIHGRYSEENLPPEAGYSPFGFEWPTDMQGETILEVGPGTGNCSEHLANTGATLVCVDMSNAIDTFPEALLARPNVNVIQGDINDPILTGEGFDRIWLFQVLQHTPSPPDTLKTMWKLLKPGGELAFTSYSAPFNPWYYPFTKRIDDERAWRLISTWVPRLVPIKYRIKKAGIPFLSRALTKVMEPIDPRNLYYRTIEGQANDYIHGALWNRNHDKELLMKYVILNTFDRITPDYTNSASHQTIERWAREAGFSSVKTWGKGGVRARAIK